MADQESSQSPSGSNAPPVITATTGRCHWCGYQLKGLPVHGKCPECGKDYTEQSAALLKPWPSAMIICLRLGWPIIGIFVSPLIPFIGILISYAMLVAVPVNSYYQVREMLRTIMPDQTRTKGPVAVLRAVGTAVCVLLLLVFVVGPIGLGIACVIILSQ